MPPVDPSHLTPREPTDRPRPCESCGYDLRGVPRDRPCPECGSLPTEDSNVFTVPGDAPGGASVSCPTCGVPTPGQPIGSLCPACARALPETASTTRFEGVGGLTGSGATCESCGYDLRGTALTGICPECGEPVVQAGGAVGPGGMVMRQVRRGERSRRMPDAVVKSLVFRGGVLMLVVALIALFITGLASLSPMPPSLYIRTLAIIATAVAVASWATTPGSLDQGHPGWVAWRFGARLLLACWPIGLWSMIRPWGFSSLQQSLLEFAGLCGMAIYTAVLAGVAAEVDLRDTARRLTTATWFVLPVGLFASVAPHPGSAFLAGPSTVSKVVASLMLLTFIPWLWLVGRIARASAEIMTYGHWAGIARREAAVRRAESISRVKDPASREGDPGEATFDWSQDKDISV